MKKEKIFEIIKKIINKMLFAIEFIISILLMTQILKIYTTKKYNGFYPLNKIILAGILGLTVICIIIYVCKKHKGIIEKIFIAFAIPISIGYAIFILPLNVPDEGSHILKAYDISRGNLLPQKDSEGNSFSLIVKDLEIYSYTRIKNYQDVFEELKQTSNYNEEVKIICAAQGYSPILYIGPALAINICRIVNLNIFYAIYMGRLFNIIIFLIFGYFSIKKIPFGKLLVAVYLCIPMMLQQAASCSTDAVLNATLIYYITHLLYIVFKKEKVDKKDLIILYILTMLIAMFKYIYILVAGILFAIIFKNREKEERKNNFKIIGIMIFIGAIFSIGWFVITSNYNSVPEAFEEYYKTANVDTSRQISYIKENLPQFIRTFIHEYTNYGNEYLFGAIGKNLGWLNINVNTGIIIIYMFILFISAISEKSKYEISPKFKIWILTIIFAISALLKIIMYLTWTPVGLDRICGVQGRYYTPILILAILCFVKKDNNWKIKNTNEKMMTISFILNSLTLLEIIQHYL